MRLATWNVNSVMARLPRLLEWLAATRPDVVCLQETKVADAAFPGAEVAELGYAAATHGDGRWNGVAILSRVGLDAVSAGFAGEPGYPEVEARAVSATCAGVRVWSVYVPNGRSLDSPHYGYKLAWLSALRDVLGSEADAGNAPLAVSGDFNVAPSDDDVWDPAEFTGSTHVSAAERQAVAALLDLGLVDVRARALKGRPFTYWDYRAGMFHKGMGMRIDLVLLSRVLAARVGDAYIDREARKGTAPSDHAPVVVELGTES
ncbi:MAG: exodeoxyribonuclease III [Candidatus Dormibacteria bacterium]